MILFFFSPKRKKQQTTIATAAAIKNKCSSTKINFGYAKKILPLIARIYTNKNAGIIYSISILFFENKKTCALVSLWQIYFLRNKNNSWKLVLSVANKILRSKTLATFRLCGYKLFAKQKNLNSFAHKILNLQL